MRENWGGGGTFKLGVPQVMYGSTRRSMLTVALFTLMNTPL